MAGASKNSRTTVATQKFICSCGGEIVMKTMFENGKIKNIAECSKQSLRRFALPRLHKRGIDSESYEAPKNQIYR